jgi:hypothetical protein
VPGPEGHIHQTDQNRHLDERADHPGQSLAAGQPNTPMATAMANSKLLLAAVNARVAVGG